MFVVYFMLVVVVGEGRGQGWADLYKKYWVARIKPHNYVVNPLLSPLQTEGGGGGAHNRDRGHI